MMATTATGSILYEEHAAILAVLDYLDQAVAALSQGRAVDAAIFRDLHEFFTLHSSWASATTGRKSACYSPNSIYSPRWPP